MFGIPPQYVVTIAALVAVIALFLLQRLLLLYGRSIPFLRKFETAVHNIRRKVLLSTSARTWTSYLQGQGMILALSLAAGFALATLSSQYKASRQTLFTGGQLIEFRQLNPAERPIKEIDVEKFSGITVLTKTTAPTNGSATVTIYRDEMWAANDQIKQIESIGTSWSRLDQNNSGKHITLMVSPTQRAGAVPATQLDLLIYLSPTGQ